MTDKIFLDTNIVIYSLSDDLHKKNIAKHLLAQKPCISVQVLNEVTNVCVKKLKLSKGQTHEVINLLISCCVVLSLTTENIQLAFDFFKKFHYSFWDCLILSSAKIEGCNVVCSEDMQDNFAIDDKTKIINPFTHF